MSDDIRIEALKEELFGSGIETSERDALADDLDYAQKINGSKDDALQGIKRITISNVRREMLAHRRMVRHERIDQNTKVMQELRDVVRTCHERRN